LINTVPKPFRHRRTHQTVAGAGAGASRKMTNQPIKDKEFYLKSGFLYSDKVM